MRMTVVMSGVVPGVVQDGTTVIVEKRMADALRSSEKKTNQSKSWRFEVFIRPHGASSAW
jgi:hypothetical protein